MPVTSPDGRKWSARLGLLAAAFGGSAFFVGAIWPLLAWWATSLAVVSLAYLWGYAKVFGKKEDGRLPALNQLILLPYLALTLLGWQLAVWLGRESMCVQVTPILWLGRWPRRGELPSDIRRVVDLTAELPGPADRLTRQYLALPALDGRSPGLAAAVAIVARLEAEVQPT